MNRSHEEILSGKLPVESQLSQMPGAMDMSGAKIQHSLFPIAGTNFQPILRLVVARLTRCESPHSAEHERSCHVFVAGYYACGSGGYNFPKIGSDVREQDSHFES